MTLALSYSLGAHDGGSRAGANRTVMVRAVAEGCPKGYSTKGHVPMTQFGVNGMHATCPPRRRRESSMGLGGRGLRKCCHKGGARAPGGV